MADLLCTTTLFPNLKCNFMHQPVLVGWSLYHYEESAQQWIRDERVKEDFSKNNSYKHIYIYTQERKDELSLACKRKRNTINNHALCFRQQQCMFSFLFSHPRAFITYATLNLLLYKHIFSRTINATGPEIEDWERIVLCKGMFCIVNLLSKEFGMFLDRRYVRKRSTTARMGSWSTISTHDLQKDVCKCAPGHIPNLACFPFLNFFPICILVPEYVMTMMMYTHCNESLGWSCWWKCGVYRFLVIYDLHLCKLCIRSSIGEKRRMEVMQQQWEANAFTTATFEILCVCNVT